MNNNNKIMNTIKEQNAQDKLFKLLERIDMGDAVYEMAQSIFQKCIDDVESNGMVVDNDGNDYDSGEAWYDDVQEDFFECVYEKLKKFL